MSQERRSSERFVIELAADLSVGTQRFTATTKDISTGGCCVVCAYALEEGITIGCSLFLVVDGIEEASMPALETRATVQWAADTESDSLGDRYMAGLKFDGMSDAQQSWLQGTLGRLSVPQ